MRRSPINGCRWSNDPAPISKIDFGDPLIGWISACVGWDSPPIVTAPRIFPEGENVNDSRFQILGSSLKTLNRTRLCADCQTLQRVTDFFPNKEALLECGHRRLVIDQAVITAFEKKKRGWHEC